MKTSRQVAPEDAAELLRAEMMLLDPVVRRNRDAVAALIEDDFLEFGSSGRVWTRDEILDLLASGEYTAPLLERFACRLVADRVALVTYRTLREKGQTGEREVTLRSSLWRKNGRRWRMSFHQGTRAS